MSLTPVLFSLPSHRVHLSGLLLALLATSPAWAFTRPATPPAPNSTDEALVTAYAYDSAGYQSQVTDNAGVKTVTEYDALGRVTAVIENHTDGTPETGSADEDRTTRYAYNAAGQVVEQTADLNNATTDGDQVTHYIYSGELASSALGSPVANHNLMRATVYPDALEGGETRAGVIAKLNAGQSGDFIATTYHADGSLAARTDPRGVTLSYSYDDAGRRTAQVVGGTSLPDGDQRVDYTYTDLAQLQTVTTYDGPSSASSATSEVAYTYTGLQQPSTESQDHKPAGGYTNGVPTLAWAYDTAASGGAFIKAARLASTTYPNGRVVETRYDAAANGFTGGAAALDDLLSRPNGLRDAASGDTLAAYVRLGDGRAIAKDLPQIATRLDHHAQIAGDDPNDFLPGEDRFGRLTRMRWDRYDPSSAPHASLNNPVFDLRHAYDRGGNRLYSADKVYPNSSNLYIHDGLHRLTRSDRGNLNLALDGMEQLFSAQDWGLDTLGNWKTYRQDDDGGTGQPTPDPWDLEQDRIHNQANEILAIAGSNTGGGGPTGNTGPFDQVAAGNSIVMEAEHYHTKVAAPNGQDWVSKQYGRDTPRLRTTATIWWAEPTDPDMIATLSVNLPTAGNYVIWGMVNPQHAGQDSLWIRVNGGSWIRWDGLLSPAGTYDWHWNTVHDSNNGGATMNFALAAGTHTIEVAPCERETRLDSLYLTSAGDTPEYTHVAATAPGVTLEAEDASLTPTTDWEIRPAYHFENASRGILMQALPVSGTENDSTYVADAPRLDYQVNFVQAGSYTIRFKGQPLLDANYANSDTVHVGLNGVRTPSAERMRSFNAAFWFSNRKIDAPRATITIPSPGVHTINVWMREDGFKADKIILVPGPSENTFSTFGPAESPRLASGGGGGGGGGALPEPEHDAAGNLTVMPVPGDWNAVYVAQYDAWNRLVKLNHATKTAGGSLTVGTILAEMQYDGLGRRTVHRYTNTPGGVLDYAYHDYYNGQQIAETRNGSDLVTRQQVWGFDYIDELVEIAHNADPADPTEQACEDRYYAMHNAQYNVLGVVAPERDGTGAVIGQTLVERYTYTPYGERNVFVQSGPGDTTATQPADHSQVTIAGATLNPFGHQGLLHDEATGLIYNRARHLHPGLGRFMQRDPLGYVDGMNSYEYVQSKPISGLDPTGLLRIRVGYRGLGPANTAGDTWHSTLIGGQVGSQMYNWSDGPASLRWMLGQIDVNGDRQIDANEIMDLDLGLHGFSQGGVGAIDVSKRLNQTRTRVEGYKFCQPVPVKILVTIDPASFAVFIPSPKPNVETAINYYQRRGGKSRIFNLGPNGQPAGNPTTFGNLFSGLILGNRISGATNKRIDTLSGHRDGIFGPGTRLHAKDVNHDTIPWYVAPDAANDLQ